MFEIGLSTCGKTIDEELFRAYNKAGISAMELARKTDEYNQLDFKKIAALAKQYGIRLNSLHLPFSPFNVFDISNASIQRQTLDFHNELIKKGADIGIGLFIVHASGEPILRDKRGERMTVAKESLCLLAEEAARNGAVIAVEDLPRTCLARNSEEVAELISVDERLRVCLDMNHLLTEALPDFIRKLGKKIVTTHVSDYDFLNERHWLPGEGDINWQEVVSALNEVGYNGAWLYEVDFVRPSSLCADRELNCADFVRNATEIFEDKPLTVLAHRVPGLEKWVEQA